jgi:hypothetical protein
MESNKKSEKRQRNPGLPGKTGLARALHSSFQKSWPSTRQVLNPALSVLIANLELEFHVSPLRITDLKFSNRKFFTVFLSWDTKGSPRAALFPPEVSSHSSLATHHCISNRDTAIRISPNYNKSRIFQISNRDKNRPLHLGFSQGYSSRLSLCLSRIMSHQSRVTLFWSRQNGPLLRHKCRQQLASLALLW